MKEPTPGDLAEARAALKKRGHTDAEIDAMIEKGKRIRAIKDPAERMNAFLNLIVSIAGGRIKSITLETPKGSEVVFTGNH